jgi:hypothetical protein
VRSSGSWLDARTDIDTQLCLEFAAVGVDFKGIEVVARGDAFLQAEHNYGTAGLLCLRG